MFSYKIFGAIAGDAGLLFHSCVPNLQDHPDLWADECPFMIPRAGRVAVKLIPAGGPDGVTAAEVESEEGVSC